MYIQEKLSQVKWQPCCKFCSDFMKDFQFFQILVSSMVLFMIKALTLDYIICGTK